MRDQASTVSRVNIFDRDNIADLPVYRTAKTQQHAMEYVTALVIDGPQAYLDNADVSAQALVVDGIVLPLIVGERVVGNADVCSPYAHYADYTTEQFSKRHARLPAWVVNAFSAPLRLLFRIADIDNVVFVNNWLLTTNPSIQLTGKQIAQITEVLKARYPDRAIVFRSINPVLDNNLYENLRKGGYTLVRSRRVYMLDACDGQHLRRENVRIDLRLTERMGYDIVKDHLLLRPQVWRLTQLYRDLYLVKHSRLNPAFNADFIRLTMKTGTLSYMALSKNNRIDSFVSYFNNDEVLTGALIGYDRQLPIELGLYRQAVALLIAEATQRQMLLNLSAGAGSFKLFRGCFPVEEYDAVYHQHLSKRHRGVWDALRRITHSWGKQSRIAS